MCWTRVVLSLEIIFLFGKHLVSILEDWWGFENYNLGRIICKTTKRRLKWNGTKNLHIVTNMSLKMVGTLLITHQLYFCFLFYCYLKTECILRPGRICRGIYCHNIQKLLIIYFIRLSCKGQFIVCFSV